MSFQKRPYFLGDIEPTIAVAEAVRWEREAAPPAPAITPAANVVRITMSARAGFDLRSGSIALSSKETAFW